MVHNLRKRSNLERRKGAFVAQMLLAWRLLMRLVGTTNNEKEKGWQYELRLYSIIQ